MDPRLLPLLALAGLAVASKGRGSRLKTGRDFRPIEVGDVVKWKRWNPVGGESEVTGRVKSLHAGKARVEWPIPIPNRSSMAPLGDLIRASGSKLQTARKPMRLDSDDFKFRDAFARTIYASRWADAMEEAGRSRELSGTDILDMAPKTPETAKKLALEWISEFYDLNRMTPSEAARQIGADDNLVQFGHLLAMEAMGTGVSWQDDHDPHGLEIPSVENYDLVYPEDLSKKKGSRLRTVTGGAGAGFVLIDRNTGAVLVLKRSQNVPYGGTWSIPGGHIDRHETQLAAAMREVSEEIGVSVSLHVQIAEDRFFDEKWNYTTFIGIIDTKAPVRNTSLWETQQLEWVPLKSLHPHSSKRLKPLHPGFEHALKTGLYERLLTVSRWYGLNR